MRRLGWLGMAAFSALVAGGCGGGSSTSATTTNASTGAIPSTTALPTFSGPKDSKFCNLARQFTDSLKLNLTQDPKVAFQQFDTLSAQNLAVVPSEIKADAQTVVHAGKQLEAVFAAANYDANKIKASDLATLQDPKIAAAASRINAYYSQVCGITTSTT